MALMMAGMTGRMLTNRMARVNTVRIGPVMTWVMAMMFRIFMVVAMRVVLALVPGQFTVLTAIAG